MTECCHSLHLYLMDTYSNVLCLTSRCIVRGQRLKKLKLTKNRAGSLSPRIFLKVLRCLYLSETLEPFDFRGFITTEIIKDSRIRTSRHFNGFLFFFTCVLFQAFFFVKHLTLIFQICFSRLFLSAHVQIILG